MKLAIIDYDIEKRGVSIYDAMNKLSLMGVETSAEESLTKFEDFYGSLENYNGLLFHPQFSDAVKGVRYVTEKYPKLKIAFVSVSTECAESSELRKTEAQLRELGEIPEIPMLIYPDANSIYRYFFGER